MPTNWWSQPQASEPTPESSDLPDERVAVPAAPPDDKTEADVRRKSKSPAPATVGASDRVQPSRRRLWLAAMLALGLLVIGVGAMAVLRVGPFGGSERDYASAMRPLLADYDAWWGGPYGALLNELNGFCGPTADGWLNQDVLLNCSLYPAVDCALLAAHCGGDVDAMRERVDELSREAQNKAQALLAALDAISPPNDIASAHAHFVACLQAQAANTDQMGDLARGGSPVGSDLAPACQMFPDAEERVRWYVDGR